MKRLKTAARAARSGPSRSDGVILVALIGACALVYSSVGYGLTLVFHWLAAHLSPAQGLGVALTVALCLRIYLSVRNAR
jgi:hypothetical protein